MDNKRPNEVNDDDFSKRQHLDPNLYPPSNQYQVFPGVFVSLPQNQNPSYQQQHQPQPVYQQHVMPLHVPMSHQHPQSMQLPQQQPQYYGYPGYTYNSYQPYQPMTTQQQLHNQWKPQSYSSYMKQGKDDESDDENDAPEISSSKLPPPPMRLQQKFTSFPNDKNQERNNNTVPNKQNPQKQKQKQKQQQKQKQNPKPKIKDQEPMKDADLIYTDSETSDIDDINDEDSKTVIQGTNIILESEEDIKKWIEERRKNWPTNKRMMEKEELKGKAEMIASKIGNESKQTSTKPICRFFQRTGRCKHGNKCKFSHEASQHQLKSLPNHKVKIIHGVPVQIPQRFSPLQNKGKSLESLLFEGEHFKTQNITILSLIEKLSEGGHLSKWGDVLADLGLM